MVDLSTIPRPTSRQSMPSTAEKVFEGRIFSAYQWQQEMYDGSLATFECLARQDTVGVLAVLDNKKILLSTQEQPTMKPFLSLLGGVIDPGETAFQAAQRELLEEAGAVAQEWDLWFATQPFSKIDWAVYMFIARGCKITQQQQLDPGEKIALKEVSFDEFVATAFQPEFRDIEVTLRVARTIQAGQIDNLKQLVLGK